MKLPFITFFLIWGIFLPENKGQKQGQDLNQLLTKLIKGLDQDQKLPDFASGIKSGSSGAFVAGGSNTQNGSGTGSIGSVLNPRRYSNGRWKFINGRWRFVRRNQG